MSKKKQRSSRVSARTVRAPVAGKVVAGSRSDEWRDDMERVRPLLREADPDERTEVALKYRHLGRPIVREPVSSVIRSAAEVVDIIDLWRSVRWLDAWLVNLDARREMTSARQHHKRLSSEASCDR